ncbi:MAG: glycosyltransferase family 4 protein [Acidobacteriaceae bacterium]|nr:glycosyltransferase family 4 protein [Acidobacteriaceae bacterium]
MHFLYHHRTAGRGAEGNHIMALVDPLERAGHTVTIVSPPRVDPRKTAGHVPLDKGASRGRGFSAVWHWISNSAPQVIFEMAELAYNLYASVALAAVIRRKRPDVYYERYAFFLFLGVLTARLFRLPVLLEVNEIAGIERARKQMLVGIAKRVERIVFRRADAIFVVSSFLRDEVIRRGAKPETVHLMPNAIDRRRFHLNGSRNEVRRERGLGSATVAGFVGWFDHWDRLDLLIDAIHELAKTNPKLRLLLVGDGPVAPELRARVEQLRLEDRVILTGAVPRDEVPHYIDAMDICVLPDSNPYGSPMVLFEFMALGKAVIAPDLPPIRDVISDGETGITVPPGNAGSLTATLRRLVDDPALRSQLGGRAQRFVLEHRTWEANANRVFAIAQQTSKGRIAA